MSLVNDALKRARIEAARQEAARRGLPLPEAVPGNGRATRHPWLVLALALLAVAAGTLLFLAGRGSATRAEGGEPGPEGLAASVATPPAEPSVSESVAEPPAPSSPQAAAAAAIERPGESTRNEQGLAPPARRRATPTAQRGNAPPGVAAAPAPGIAAQPAPMAPSPTAGRTFIGEVEVPGAGKLELEGIAWTENRPFALINGRVVAPGERIAGLRIIRIDPKEVELQGEGSEPIVLRLR